VMVLHLAVVIAAVEPHAWRVRPPRRSLAFADLLEPQNLRPEPVRLFEGADIENKMVQSDWGDRAGRRGLLLGHGGFLVSWFANLATPTVLVASMSAIRG